SALIAEELRSISMRCWQTWHWKKATKGSLKPSNYGFDPIRPRNVMANCLTEFSRVWAYNPRLGPLTRLVRRLGYLRTGSGAQNHYQNSIFQSNYYRNA